MVVGFVNVPKHSKTCPDNAHHGGIGIGSFVSARWVATVFYSFNHCFQRGMRSVWSLLYENLSFELSELFFLTTLWQVIKNDFSEVGEHGILDFLLSICWHGSHVCVLDKSNSLFRKSWSEPLDVSIGHFNHIWIYDIETRRTKKKWESCNHIVFYPLFIIRAFLWKTNMWCPWCSFLLWERSSKQACYISSERSCCNIFLTKVLQSSLLMMLLISAVLNIDKEVLNHLCIF